LKHGVLAYVNAFCGLIGGAVALLSLAQDPKPPEIENASDF
jgi:hypothetical protein